jgi:hypothetical protein
MKQTMPDLDELRIERPLVEGKRSNPWVGPALLAVALASGASLTGWLRGKARAIQVRTAVACDVRRAHPPYPLPAAPLGCGFQKLRSSTDEIKIDMRIWKLNASI